MPATPTPTHAPVIETVTPEYTQHVINPKDVNPIFFLYMMVIMLSLNTKEKKFGDTVLSSGIFRFDIVTSDVENPDIYFGAADSYTDVEGITTFREITIVTVELYGQKGG